MIETLIAIYIMIGMTNIMIISIIVERQEQIVLTRKNGFMETIKSIIVMILSIFLWPIIIFYLAYSLPGLLNASKRAETKHKCELWELERKIKRLENKDKETE